MDGIHAVIHIECGQLLLVNVNGQTIEIKHKSTRTSTQKWKNM